MHASARQPAQKGADTSAMDLLSSPQQMQQDSPPEHAHQQLQQQLQQQDTFSTPPPLMHFPHCRLDITTFPCPPHTNRDGTPFTGGSGKLEQIALPGALVRTLLSRFKDGLQKQHQQQHQPPPPPPHPSKTRPSNGKERTPVHIQPHFDDADDWVFSRCLLADFTGFREDEAEVLSGQGRLCCWASVVLQPQQQQQGQHSQQEGEGEPLQDNSSGKWELGFVVQRVGVRDPGSGWCECF
ncbi:hypothetical protein C8A01DRAFT_42817 [Parachaetomium inaequale]|uniref:Uncharacterized protein n=1 Tax=Parachaetomium inaequale TaxID=2588326 RepID=A0AAN6PT62_9PEZI|nr:hypothetical protein C8A01DRAFT_42817 [Parachaetomium inaequale]